MVKPAQVRLSVRSPLFVVGTAALYTGDDGGDTESEPDRRPYIVAVCGQKVVARQARAQRLLGLRNGLSVEGRGIRA